jgi:hypothetical protein
MSITVLRGVPDRVAARRLTVIKNPLLTDRCYCPELDQVDARLEELEEACGDADCQKLSSVLNDMAECLGFPAHDEPTSEPDFGSVSRLFPELEDEVLAGDIMLVEDIVVEMLEAARL